MLSGSLAGSERRSHLCTKSSNGESFLLPANEMTDVKVISTWSLAEKGMTGGMVTKRQNDHYLLVHKCVPDITGIRAAVGKHYLGKFGNTRYTFPMVKRKVEISCEIPEKRPSKNVCIHRSSFGFKYYSESVGIGGNLF